MSKINNPHDLLFKNSMLNPRVSKEFLKTHLPAEILSIVNLNHLIIQKESFIDKSLKLSMTDLLFQTTFSGEEGYLYFLIEHQSTPEKWMPLRVLKYIINIMEEDVKKTKEKTLPIVYPMIFNTLWMNEDVTTAVIIG